MCGLCKEGLLSLMNPVQIVVNESRGVARENYLLEQGIPIAPVSRDKVASLGIYDAEGNRYPAGIQAEATDHNGDVNWLLLTMPVNLGAGADSQFLLRDVGNEQKDIPGPALIIDETEESFTVLAPKYSATFTSPGGIQLKTSDGIILDGNIDLELRSDARSTVGGLRPAYFEPTGFAVAEKTDKRVKIVLTGKHRCKAPKSTQIDKVQGYDVDIELVLYADSPVIRFKWTITCLMRFNCSFMWLDRYVLSFPLADNARVCAGDPVAGQEKYAEWVTCQASGGEVTLTAPFYHWLGKGAGIEVKEGRLGHGGINPPVDGGFGGATPDIHRKFFYGMSRTFEGSLLVGASREQVLSELKPLPLILTPKYYSEVGELPEEGSEVTWGPWKDVVDRAADWLLKTQWKGTLWFGEWWREIDVKTNLGIEETNSGNSALAPLYHFYRTGDWRFWESAKMSYYYTYDIQFNKDPFNKGPYMHTRRFLMDHLEWFHPRYQRIAGIMRVSHLFGHRRVREKVVWMMRHWAENYVAPDGAPQLPEGKEGTIVRCDERAMSNINESFMLAYIETRDPLFLETSRRMGNWIVESLSAEDWETIAENSNSTRYIQQGLLPLCKILGDQKYKDMFIRVAKWTVNSQRFHFGTHYVAFHFNYACQAYKMSGDREILEGILNLAHWVLSCESKTAPGTYPFKQDYQIPDTEWLCSYDNTAIVSYLPVLASTLEEAGMKAE